MSTNTIQFLEALGAAPLCAAGAYANDVAALPVAAEQRAALLGRDAGALARLLEARPTMICMIVAPNGDVPEDERRDDKPDREDAPAEPDQPHAPDSDR